MSLKFTIPILILFSLTACSHGNCRSQKAPAETASAQSALADEPSLKGSSNVDRVKVFKPDGTLQCKQGKLIPLGEMQKELTGIQIYSAENKNDGMMRIQVCGSPTGNSNVYEISRADLEKALSKGFKEWLGE